MEVRDVPMQGKLALERHYMLRTSQKFIAIIQDEIDQFVVAFQSALELSSSQTLDSHQGVHHFGEFQDGIFFRIVRLTHNSDRGPQK